ncbi:MAG TPA: IS66 family transposase [Polyangia bacterium]|jgi:transposase
MKRKKRRGPTAPAQRRELRLDELTGIVERAKAALSDADHATLKAAVETLAFLTQELEAKGTTVERLRKWLFGASTEKTSQVLGDPPADADAGDATGAAPDAKPKAPGHGRHGAAAYRGAAQVTVPHESLHRGDACPACLKGKVYPMAEPAVLVRVTGMAPLTATVYACERLRCNLCGEVFTAAAPPGVGADKYDETAASMIGLLRYGAGLPFNRLETLQRGLGIPLPAATQWELVERAAGQLAPAHDELIRQAAQGEVLHNDDTTMKVLALMGAPHAAAGAGAAATTAGSAADARTGVYTSGIVAVGGGHRIALFFTGHQHAGENLAAVLAQRATELPVPIQMSDLLSHNTAGDFTTLAAGCIAHSRRRYVEVADHFPAECRFVLETLREVYKHDALAEQRHLSAAERLQFHQAQSGPLMADLEAWLRAQFDERKVEPNSSLGEAISFMQKHWSRLTLFLRVAGAPLDNNVCERALKKAICHRKNSLFYKTLNGAHVGDVFMALIHTTELNGADPFAYLVALQRHHDEVVDEPAAWMPWNYQDALARLATAPASPP